MQAIVFDIDNTLTAPRRPLEAEMADVLRRLRVPFHVAAGSDLSLVRAQLIEPLQHFHYRGTFDAFVCNGSDRYRCELGDEPRLVELRTFDLQEYLGDAGFALLMDVIDRALTLPELALSEGDVVVMGARVRNRGSMVNVAPIGRPDVMTPEAYTNRDAFVRFDRTSGYRRRFLHHLERELADLRRDKGLRIALGGQTSFDIVVEGNDKRYPLRMLLSEGYTQLTYIGDALFEGGNDAAVLDLIRDWPEETPCPVTAVQVEDWRDTIKHLRRLGLYGPAL